MNATPPFGPRRTGVASLWADPTPARAELFGVERLEQHAETLAAAQHVSARPPRVPPLGARLRDNAVVLLAAYRASAAEAEAGRPIVPAADWLLDNYHLVEAQIREIREDLPPGYYRQLPKLVEGPFAGYPRVFGLAWAYVAHSDSHFDPETLRRYLVAYQRAQPLTIGELWAVPITLRIVLVENLRRLADQITAAHAARASADALADAQTAAGRPRRALEAELDDRDGWPLSDAFAAQLAKRLRDRDPETTPALGWLEARLEAQGLSIDVAVNHALERQGASNVTVRNIITSMRLISDMDWPDLFESVSLVDARLRAESAFGAMDFPSRNLYRSAIEELARGSGLSELEVAGRALDACRTAGGATVAGRSGDPGWHLVSGGRRAFEKAIGFRPSARRWPARLTQRLGLAGYAGAIVATTAALLALSVWLLWLPGVGAGWLAAWALAATLPASEAATALVNRVVAWSFGATILPGLELKDGVPSELRTLVVVPTLLTGEADLREQIERLEVHHLSGAGGDLTFALLTDGLDAAQAEAPGDADLLALGRAAIAELNARHAPGPAGPRFLLLHRRRLFNPGEGVWMGWERKRGKLHELNRLLRGATDTSFESGGDAVPPGVRYVVTLDVDTRLPRDAAARLVGKMAHPLNRPGFDAATGRVVTGHAILQPRVTPSLPQGRAGSIYQRTVSGPGGMDPYAAAVSDVYQDLFGEGSYTGKGIYDVDAFEAALAGRVPENTMLSHDLFEGVFARAGLASDVELVEEFPARYDVDARRQHRWTRGDWQLLPWIAGAGGVSPVGRWKMLDNLRRALLAPFTLAALGIGWTSPPAAATATLLILLAAAVIPAFLPGLSGLLPRRAGIRLDSHLRRVAGDLRLAAMQVFFVAAFLADRAWRMGDAILRTLLRVYRTRRRLLEWTTAAQASGRPRPGLAGFARDMAGGVALGLGVAGAAVALAPASWPLAAPFALLWLAAPALALWVSREPPAATKEALSAEEARALRLIARRTWRYFETFATAAENMLPPDNFQDDPRPAVAHRTSPTNLGLHLLSAVAARDFGWTGALETVERLESSLDGMLRLPRHRGHFFNWYDTQDLRVLDPAYVSSVDSGNLAGHLIALANACEEAAAPAPAPDPRPGLRDALDLAREAVAADPEPAGEALAPLAAMERALDGDAAPDAMLPELERLAVEATAALEDWPGAARADALFWVGALRKAAAEHLRDRGLCDAARELLAARYLAVAEIARRLAMEMDFAFLLDPDRKLLSIGYSVADNRLDPSCYDLLASECRLGSLVAIAKGDAPTRHWFRLSRSATPLGTGAALISWSGSMFEYLMPTLVMREPPGSVLGQTNRLVVARQQAYGRSLGVPWGVSESGYNARDLELTYQYSNFGVPGLGLKRGLAKNVVIAPYATGLAAMVDPKGAVRNFARLEALGAKGRYGFYEALDFNEARRRGGAPVAVVRNFMAHHQGMTVVAIANVLQDGRMRDRFHREPIVRASELLLQERIPRDVALAPPRAEEVTAPATEPGGDFQAVRRHPAPTPGPPVTHLMSNGRYSVMLTAAGGGYSRWGDIAVTRWREDATRDDWGAFVYLRDVQGGAVWSPCLNPLGRPAARAEAQFTEDHARFTHPGGTLTTTLDVLVSGEDDCEVRQVSLVNRGRRTREIEVTSFAELVLTTPAADAAHPAFAKLFVQTEHLADSGALLATRRPRAPDEPPVWAAHLAVVEGETVGAQQFETDRARFIGRSRTAADAAAILQDRPLSGTVGTVLDPVFALRRRLRIPPGAVARIAFWTLVAPSRAELLDLIDKHHDPSAFDRAHTLAWTQAQVQLRHLDIDAHEAADFQRLAAPILYADARFRPPQAAILRGAGPQAGLWPHAISGDLPIVLLRIDDLADMAQVRQLLRAHEYWRMKRLAVDLVIVNEHPSSYAQDLQTAIETAVRSSQSRPRFGRVLAQGSAFVLRADLLSGPAREHLAAVARVALSARGGPLADQLALIPAPAAATALAVRPPAAPLPRLAPPPHAELEVFNGLGGFDKDGREYVTILDGAATTPAPWINVIANSGFGFQVSVEGGGYVWAENSRENQLTPWSNDPVGDPAGEAIYLRDEATGEVWTVTAQPIRDGGRYVARHGFGYSRFEHSAQGVAADLLQFVPLDDPIRISRLRLRNLTDRPRRLTVTSYAEWALGASRAAAAPFIATGIDAATGAMFARNPWSTDFPGRTAFADLRGRQTAWTADRTEFLGRGGSPAAPAALLGEAPLSGATGAARDPCAALAAAVTLPPGGEVELTALLGQGGSAEAARALVLRYRAADLDAVLEAVHAHWRDVLGAVQVRTPDRAMDILLNGWLLYQTLACRIRARAGFYQASGAYGFRDQLQDGMALSFAAPQETRAHLLRAASRQFVEGDVQHWWLPHSGQGVRTRISDDRVWLAYAAASYVLATGDAAVLDVRAPFLEGPPLAPGEHDAFFQPMAADVEAPLFEHCARGLDQCLELTGPQGLPLIGTGDWNDGMNRVGAGGRGESVWLGWLLLRTIALFAPLAETRDPGRARRWRAHAEGLARAMERVAWDGAWYRRATFDDGAWLGSAENAECRIDSIAQSWAVLSGAANPARAAQAMDSLEHHLIRDDDGVALLFTPPFDRTPRDPGYIKGYPPGLRENGGQYSHAAMWAILAFARRGDADRAAALFALLNPINHARTPAEVQRYRVEPYVVAADVYSVAPNAGRGGWTWYTGAAGWMYRAGVEGLLGLRREGAEVVVAPRLPSAWPDYAATVVLGGARLTVRVTRAPEGQAEALVATLDGRAVACGATEVRVVMDGVDRELEILAKSGDAPGRR